MIAALLTGTTSCSFVEEALRESLCDRACQLSDGLLSRGRGVEACEMLRAVSCRRSPKHRRKVCVAGTGRALPS